jgi:hypothetical protein
VDGIHLDYIRYNHLTNGWSAEDFAAMEARGIKEADVRYLINKTFYQDQLPAGETVDAQYAFNALRNGDPTAVAVAKYRRDNIVEFATVIKSAIEASGKDVVFSGALQPEGGIKDYTLETGSLTTDDWAFADLHYGQNYADAAELYDYICPMAYSPTFGRAPDWMTHIANRCVELGNEVVMGLQSFSPLTTARLMADIEAVRGLLPMEGVLGIAHFRHTQFSYAKTNYNYNTGVMDIEYINASESGAIKWVKVDVPAGMKITKASVVSGFKSSSPISVSSDGRTATIGYSDTSSSTILAALGEGKLRVQFTGRPNDETVRASLVRSYIGSGETRVYNVYEDMTNFKVTFVDHDGTTLATKTVAPGGSAEAPEDPIRYGYVFAGWDKSFEAVNSDLTVTARYEKIQVAG